ncbi:MAG: hypothetical protein WBP41_02370 [Saprospiraceae bacterium]
MSNWTKEIKAFFESSFEFTKGYTLIEIICIASLSISSSQVDKFLSPWSLLIFVSVIVLFITYLQRNKFLNKFPKSLIDSVEQSLNLKDVEIERRDSEIERIKVEKSKGRSGLINDAISRTIVGLNNQTCSLSERENIDEIANKLCDKDVMEGLAQILTPLITEIYTIVEDEDSKILIGVYFDKIAQDRGQDFSIEESYPFYFTLKDDIGIKEPIPSFIVENKKVTGDLLKIQQAFETCLRNNRFIIQELELFNEVYQTVVSPIPYACDENEASGATLFILQNANFPKDFERIVKIFNRLLTNWMYKHNSCVFGRSTEVWQELHDDTGKKYQLFHNDRYKVIEATGEYSHND